MKNKISPLILAGLISFLSESISPYPRVFLSIREYFSLSESISLHPRVFLPIREYFSPSESIQGLNYNR
jgi:uncharacterized Zn-finger protein